MEEISAQELEERVALLKKFRSLLQQQRDKFREYLTVLEKQENSITTENADALLVHTELEQQVVSNIMNLQKVIVPMSDLYKERGGDQKEASITSLQNDLSDLQDKVLAQNKKNRDLLRSHIASIRTQISSFRNPYKSRRSIYAEKTGTGSMVAVEI
ncbi:MAG: flagellar biosynthesis protein FlgN [Treponema sp.]|nr:flagellar biosynthesis protein FlgN [Treponema sp.]